MTATHANGLAIALIDHGKVRYVQAYGIRNAKGDPRSKDTVMYGAALTASELWVERRKSLRRCGIDLQIK